MSSTWIERQFRKWLYTPEAHVAKDRAEEAYWRFDARRNGLGPWKGMPQSERDAFKAEYRKALSGGGEQ